MSVDLAPDYTKSVAEVYYEATKACIVEFPLYWGLDSFGYERGEGDVIEELPTWVPNWYCGSFRWNSTKNRAMRLPEHAKLWTYQDPPANRCLVPESSSGKILSIRGVVLETIVECSKAFNLFDRSGRIEFMSSACRLLLNENTHASTGVEHFNRLHHVLGAGSHHSTDIRRCLEFLEFYPSNDHVMSEGSDLTTHAGTGVEQCNRLYHVLVAGSYVSTEIRRCLEFLGSCPSNDHVMSEGSDLTTHSTNLSTQIKNNGLHVGLRRLRDAMNEALESCVERIEACFHRKVFKTQSGLLGIGPKALQNGDVVIVSRLSMLPMVIRRAVHSGPDHYTVIDNAFVEGVHNGEEILAAAAKRNAMETIHLL
jgi:hypothetical protein